MKTIFRFLSLGAVLSALLAVGAAATFAQDPCADADGQAALDKTFRDNYGKPAIADRQVAVDAGKQFLEKYGACEVTHDFSEYLKTAIPSMEKKIAIDKKKAVTDALYKRFDDSFKAQNWDEVYASGKEILTGEPDKLDVILILGSIGFDQAAKKNNKYNDDTLRYAKMALQKMSSGTTSKTYGLFGYKYETKDNATGWMNLIVGYIMYNGQNDKKGALSYIYQASLVGPETKDKPLVYETIGKYFLGETIRLSGEVKALVAAQDPKDPPEVAAKKEAEVKGRIALLNGNAERAMDAYARAYKVTKGDAATKTYKDGLYQKIQDLYTVRFQKSDGLEAYIASTTAKPLVDPTSTVAPIEDPEVKPVVTTNVTPTTTTPATVKPAKPATTGTVKSPVSVKDGGASVSPAETASTAKPKAPVKKPVVAKKKSTR